MICGWFNSHVICYSTLIKFLLYSFGEFSVLGFQHASSIWIVEGNICFQYFSDVIFTSIHSNIYL